MKKSRHRGALASVLLAVLLMAACTNDGGPQNEAKAAAEGSGGTLRVGVIDWFNGYDPQALRNAAIEFELGRCCLGRTLLSYNGRPTEEGGTTLRPDLATDLPTVSDDGLTWTFHLKEGLHYGPPLEDTEIVAQDFIRSLERGLSPVPPTYPFGGEVLGGYFASFYLDQIEGAQDYVQGRVDNISGVEATDDHTLAVHLTKPTGDLGYRFAMPPSAPLPPNPDDPTARFGVAEGHEDHYGRYQVSSGPYMLEGSDDLDFSQPPDQQVPARGFGNFTFTLVRNPSWEPSSDSLRAAYADRIVIVPASDDQVEAEGMVKAGRVDLLLDSTTPGDVVRTYRNDPDLAGRVYLTPLDIVRFVGMRLAVPPFNDLHVRKAVNLAMDKQALLDVLQAEGSVASIIGHIAPDSEENNLLVDYDPYSTPGHHGDLRKARAEMARSRYDRDHDGVCDSPACKGVAVHVRADTFADIPTAVVKGLAAIGITMKLTLLEADPFFGDIADPRNQISMWFGDGWVKDYPSASTFFPPLFKGGANVGDNNWSFVGARPDRLKKLGYEPLEIPSVDDRIDECSELLFETQVSCWAQLDQYMMENVVPWVPLFNELTARTVSERVASLSFDQFVSMPALDRIRLTGEGVTGAAPLPTPSPSALSDIPTGTYAGEITRKDAERFGVKRRDIVENTGPFELTLDGQNFRIEFTADRPYFAPVVTGIYEGSGDRTTFETVTPIIFAGERVDLRWRTTDGAVSFKVLAVHPDDAGFLAAARATFESHPLLLKEQP